MAKSYLGGSTLITRYDLLPKKHKVKIGLYISAKQQAKALKYCSEVRRIDPITGAIIESIKPREIIRARNRASKLARKLGRNKRHKWRRRRRYSNEIETRLQAIKEQLKPRE